MAKSICLVPIFALFFRRYIRLPNYDEEGHKTWGNWYAMILNAYGNPIKHYGDFDVSLKVDQEEANLEHLTPSSGGLVAGEIFQRVLASNI
ncbi:hypothetical protein N9118_11275 [Akkermansiaceae bacterium]|nr:hypothetical protein [Akkermansiaceae bacterium]